MKTLAEIEEQAYEIACELDSPNSIDFDDLLERIEVDLINEHYPSLMDEEGK